MDEASKARAMISRIEGRRRRVYIDKLGNRSIGIGFNLERADAGEVLRRLGANWRLILFEGEGALTDEQIDRLFEWCFTEAFEHAQALFDNWDHLIPEARVVLVDMSYQLGGRLAGFHRMREAIALCDWRRMIDEMRASQWAKQDPDRCARNCAVMEAGIDASRQKGGG